MIETNIQLRKNYKFKGGYNIKGREGVFFFKEAKIIDNSKVSVPYVFYSKHYRKHYEDIAYFSISEYSSIKNVL